MLKSAELGRALSKQDYDAALGELRTSLLKVTRDGIILLKFWLQISPEEQLRRFEEREREPWKQHKITAEDYRNRLRTHQYEAAASEMISRNSTEFAPRVLDHHGHGRFTLVEAEDKRYARIKVLETVCQQLEDEL